ncbi:hypothetical protein A9G07_04150 [Gilliamella sp. wkB72]|nr:hypothetical protein A9G07_04150 [Gilliamella apicola]
MLLDMNTHLFLLINAQEQASKLFILFAIFCANYLIFVPIVILGICFLFKPVYRQLIIKIALGLAVALFVTFVIRHLFYSPRPFVLNIGTNYLNHDKTSSLPSQHAVFIWSICFSLYLNYKKQFKALTYLCTIVALLVCWSRIYLGVHWPLDILVGMLLSFISVYLVKKIWFIRSKSFK